MSDISINKIPFDRCTKVLPTAYDDSLSYYENLCKLTEKMNEIIYAINTSFESLVREQVNKFFVTSMYDENTRTLILSLKEGE